MQGGMSSSQQQEMEVKQVIFEMATDDKTETSFSSAWTNFQVMS